MRRGIVIVGLIAVLVIVVVAASLSRGELVQVAVAERGLMRAFVEERAVTRLPQVHRITMPSTGRLLALELEEGDRVEAGQVVARLAPRDLQLAVEAGKARVAELEAQIVRQDNNMLEEIALAAARDEVNAMDQIVAAADEQTKAAQARVELADWDLKRVEGLIAERAAAEKELRESRFTQNDASIQYKTDMLVYRASQALQIAWHLMPTMITQYIDNKKLTRAVLEQELAAAAADLAQLELTQQRATLTSPVDGAVLTRAVSNERVLTAGTLLMEIGRLEDLEVEVEVLTEDAVQVKVGQAVDVLGPSIGTTPARGTVARIYPEGFTKISSLGVEQQRVKVIVDFDAGELERLAVAGHELGSAYRVRGADLHGRAGGRGDGAAVGAVPRGGRGVAGFRGACG